jgi:WD40 repeat protein
MYYRVYPVLSWFTLIFLIDGFSMQTNAADLVRPRKSFSSDASPPSSIAFSTSGSALAVGTGLGRIILYSTTDGSKTKIIRPSESPYYSMAFSKDDSVLFALTLDRCILINTADGKVVMDANLKDIHFSRGWLNRDGKSFLVGSPFPDGRVRRFTTENQQPEIVFSISTSALMPPKSFAGVNGVVASSNGEFIAVATVEGLVIIDAKSKKELHFLTGNGTDVSAIVLSPNEKMLLNSSPPKRQCLCRLGGIIC